MNTATSVYHKIRADIVSGTLESGTPLRQDQLASQLGVSKIPVREALVLLEADGFVEAAHGRGAIVANLSTTEAEEIYLMRVALEPILLRRAIPHSSAVIWARAEGVLGALDVNDLTFSQWHALDHEFHTMLYQSAPLPRMQKTVSALHNNLGRYFKVYQSLGGGFQTSSSQEHRDLLTACRAGDADTAARILTDHLHRSEQALITALDTYTQEGDS